MAPKRLTKQGKPSRQGEGGIEAAIAKHGPAKQPCIELHCSGIGQEHNYGDKECDWVLRLGTVVPKSAFDSSTSPNRVNRTNK